MIIGYVLVGVFTGALAFFGAILAGASFWIGLGFYTLTGSAVLMLLSVTQRVAFFADGHNKNAAVEDHQNELISSPATALQASLTGPVGETSMRILAVDDNPFILELIPMISAKAGFSEVTPVASGEQALRVLASSKVAFDCLLFDINMPGMDGIELCRRVRQLPLYRHTPIVMLTAMRDMKNMGEAFRAGATDYATKPFDIEELGMRLRLAQEAIPAHQDPTPAMQRGAKSPSTSDPGYRFKLPEMINSGNVDGLVNHSVLLNYLTQLPQKEMTDVQVFAVSIDRIEAIQTQASAERFVSLLEDVATATAGSFGVDRTLLAFTDNATLLVATNSASPLPAIHVEIDIERQLQRSASELGTGEGIRTSVSVGGPIQPQGAKAQRARTAADRAIAMAENRALDKQDRLVVRLFKR